MTDGRISAIILGAMALSITACGGAGDDSGAMDCTEMFEVGRTVTKAEIDGTCIDASGDEVYMSATSYPCDDGVDMWVGKYGVWPADTMTVVADAPSGDWSVDDIPGWCALR